MELYFFTSKQLASSKPNTEKWKSIKNAEANETFCKIGVYRNLYFYVLVTLAKNANECCKNDKPVHAEKWFKAWIGNIVSVLIKIIFHNIF